MKLVLNAVVAVLIMIGGLLFSDVVQAGYYPNTEVDIHTGDILIDLSLDTDGYIFGDDNGDNVSILDDKGQVVGTYTEGSPPVFNEINQWFKNKQDRYICILRLKNKDDTIGQKAGEWARKYASDDNFKSQQWWCKITDDAMSKDRTYGAKIAWQAYNKSNNIDQTCVDDPTDFKITNGKPFTIKPRDFIASSKLKKIYEQFPMSDSSDLAIIPKFMTKNDCYTEGRKIDVKGIMVHSTAVPGMMAGKWFDSSNWNKPGSEGGRQACVHAFLDDKVVYQNLPWNHRGWHAGSYANNTHIGFEICEPDGILKYNSIRNKILEYDPNDENNKEYFDAIWKNAILLCVKLCKEFNIDPSNITSHQEGYVLGIASNHEDPKHWWSFHDKDIDMFRKDVATKLEEKEFDIAAPTLIKKD